jgi:hypothetical protein
MGIDIHLQTHVGSSIPAGNTRSVRQPAQQIRVKLVCTRYDEAFSLSAASSTRANARTLAVSDKEMDGALAGGF